MPLHAFAQWWEAYHGISRYIPLSKSLCTKQMSMIHRPARYMLHPGRAIYHASDLRCLWFGASRPRCLHHASSWVSRWKPRATLVESIVFDSTSRLLIWFCFICPQAMRISSMLPLVGVPVSLRHQQGFALMPLGLHGPVLIILMLRLSPNSIMEHRWTLSP